MKTKKAYQERGDLTKPNQEKLWELIKSCWENVVDLVQDSEILFKKMRFSRAYVLAYTALEELGKYLIVCDYYNKLVSEEDFEKAFHNHGIKPGYLFNMVVKSDKSQDEIVYDEKKFGVYFQLRNNAMYIGWDKKSEIINKPVDQVDKETAERMITLVKNQVKDIRFAKDLNGRIGSKALYR